MSNDPKSQCAMSLFLVMLMDRTLRPDSCDSRPSRRHHSHQRCRTLLYRLLHRRDVKRDRPLQEDGIAARSHEPLWEAVIVGGEASCVASRSSKREPTFELRGEGRAESDTCSR